MPFHTGNPIAKPYWPCGPRYGDDALTRLRGMYAAALYESGNRDRRRCSAIRSGSSLFISAKRRTAFSSLPNMAHSAQPGSITAMPTPPSRRLHH